MPHLDYLTSVVRVFDDGNVSGLFEIRTYADAWIEMCYDGCRFKAYQFHSRTPA